VREGGARMPEGPALNESGVLAGEGRNLRVELLRALAVIAVFFQHVDNLPSEPEGWAAFARRANFTNGVDLFFCISGFVIAKSWWEAREKYPREHVGAWRFLGAFAVRRAFRLLPASWVWLLLCVVAFGWYVRELPNTQPRLVAEGALAAFLNVSNLYWAGWTSAMSGVKWPNPDTVGIWYTLSMEEQFYLLFALSAMWLPRRVMLWVFAAAVIGQFAVLRTHFQWASVLRTDAFMLGVLVQAWSGTEWWRQRVLPWVRMPVVSVVLVLGAVVMLFWGARWVDLRGWTFGTGLAALAAGVLVVWASAELRERGERVGVAVRALTRSFAWVGGLSYGIYLTHLLVMAVVFESCVRGGWLSVRGTAGGTMTAWEFAVYVVVAGVGTGVCAWVSYGVVESPLRRWGRELSDGMLRRGMEGTRSR